jgi:hypothetical protein
VVGRTKAYEDIKTGKLKSKLINKRRKITLEGGREYVRKAPS